MVEAKPLVSVAVLGASEELTVTLLDLVLRKTELELIEEWPEALAISVTVLSSGWATVKVQDPVAPGAIGAGGQLTFVAVPTLPAAHAGVNPLTVKILPY
jgi:hypothetical protein